MSDTDYLKRIYERPMRVVDQNTAEELASLKQQLAEAKKDAERYRWLRKRGISLTGSTRGWRSGEYLDKHIDAAVDQAMREGE